VKSSDLALEEAVLNALRARQPLTFGNTEVRVADDHLEVWLCGRNIAKLHPPSRMSWSLAGQASSLTFRRLNALFKAFSPVVHSIGRDRGVLTVHYHNGTCMEILRHTDWFDA
jgi:hypothetical protein